MREREQCLIQSTGFLLEDFWLQWECYYWTMNLSGPWFIAEEGGQPESFCWQGALGRPVAGCPGHSPLPGIPLQTMLGLMGTEGTCEE